VRVSLTRRINGSCCVCGTGHFGGEWAEFNAPPDTIQLISEAQKGERVWTAIPLSVFTERIANLFFGQKCRTLHVHFPKFPGGDTSGPPQRDGATPSRIRPQHGQRQAFPGAWTQTPNFRYETSVPIGPVLRNDHWCLGLGPYSAQHLGISELKRYRIKFVFVASWSGCQGRVLVNRISHNLAQAVSLLFRAKHVQTSTLLSLINTF